MSDVDVRKRTVADALLRIAARDGIDAVSMRVVAAEAGWSLGMVQRVAGSYDDLLVLGMERVIGRADARIAAADTEGAGSAAGALRRLVDALLDDDAPADGLVWSAFVARALVTPRLAAIARRQDDEAHSALRLLIAAAGGETADETAETLLALLNGLGTAVLLGRITSAQARDTARAYLDSELPG